MAVLILNRELYIFFSRQHGFRFLAACIPLHLLYFVYSGVSYLLVWVAFRVGMRAHRGPLAPSRQRRAS